MFTQIRFSSFLLIFFLSFNSVSISFGQNSYRDNLGLLLADSLLLFEQYERALQRYLDVADEMEGKEDFAGAGYALCQAVIACLEMKDTTRAHNLLRQAEVFLDRLPPEHVENVRYLLVTGISSRKQGDFENAGTFLQKALKTTRSCCSDESELLGDIYFQLGKLNQEVGHPKDIEEHLLKSISYYQRLRDFRILKKVRAHASLADTYISRGDTKLYSEQIQIARNILEPKGLIPSTLYEDIMLEYGINFIHSDHFDSAFVILRKLFAREILKSNPSAGSLGYLSALQGHCLVETKQDSADQYLLRALSYLTKVPVINHRFISYTRRQLGIHHTNQNDFRAASQQFMMAWNHALKSTKREQSLVNQNLAELYLKAKEFDEAIIHIDKALEIVGFRKQEKALSEKDFSERNVDDFFDPLILKGEILRQKYQDNGGLNALAKALQTYQDIENIASFYRADIYSVATENIVSDHYHRSAEGALLCLEPLLTLDPEKEYLESAFRFMERNRYAQLFESIDRTATGLVVGVPGEVLRRETELIASIENLERQMDQSENDWIDSIQIARNEYWLLQNEIRTKYPTYYQIRYDSMQTMTQVQELLNEGSQILEYFWGDSIISILSISSDTASLRNVKRSLIEQELSRLLNWLIVSYLPDSLQMDHSDFRQISHHLFKYLVEPSLINESNHLIISSDGLLSLLPFGLLVTGKSDLNFKDGSYLIKEKEIQYAYSSNLLFKSGQQEPLIRPKVLAMSYSDDHMEESGSEKYLELPYSAVEVDAIQRKFKQARSSILKGEHATESALRELIGSMDIVHLAVHGIGDVDYEYNSRLVFKSDKDSLDGQLFAHELYGLSHSLRLAVLSACETGIGKNYPGEGVFSIGRAFAVTGTPSLVMSLWEVPDHSTATIIANFYSHLSDGHRVSKALQLAKIDYLESQHRGLALPFYWAALIPMGDMSPLVKSNAKIPASILIFSILMVGLLVLWKSKR